jgi:hypothetical protein
MNFTRHPEGKFAVTVVLLMLSGVICQFAGGSHWIGRIGGWIVITVFLLACLPLLAAAVYQISQKLRRIIGK